MSSDSNGHSTYLNVILLGKDSFISSSSETFRVIL